MKCPGCGTENSIEIRPRSYTCTADGCNFVLWIDSLNKLGKSEITETEAQKLIAGEQIELKKLTGKNGKKFDCRGELEQRDYNGKTGWSVKLIFEQRKLAETLAPATVVIVTDETNNDDAELEY
ncbi:hypothetical protein [Trichlorobacter lovleyi]|uniref:hypothetical protein n=1 Tax=Trichlorobacter lovleyi TaxID=313985 RepID=UPI002FDE6072